MYLDNVDDPDVGIFAVGNRSLFPVGVSRNCGATKVVITLKVPSRKREGILVGKKSAKGQRPSRKAL